MGLQDVDGLVDIVAVQQASGGLAAWWHQLAPPERADLLELPVDSFLPEHLVQQLRTFGVDIPDVAVALRLWERSFAVYAQPAAMQEFLSAARVWAVGWAADSA
ncbi:hypothetical protein [Kineococcus sp. SYSU DK003]|uniref:hypothetical protein n=1 Tax=Kineococcus sp. SYSU DK003 TaxID=3383124 RepID=UPI003D7D1D0E